MFIFFAPMVIFVQDVCSRSIVRLGGRAEKDLLEQAKAIDLSKSEAPSGQKNASVYERFKIETRLAPPRRRQPHPFNPSVSRVGLARTLLAEALQYGFKLKRREYRRTLLSRPCIYGVFSGRFGGFHPIKDRCTGCMRCVQEHPNVCRVDRNPEFFKFADSYWIPEDPATASSTPVSIVSYEAETGKIPIKGMGYKGSFAGRGWDSIWTDMSEIVRPTRDGVYGREYISTIVDLGRKPKFLEFSHLESDLSRTVEVSMPIIFDYLPPNLNSQSILSSVASASKRTRTSFIASPEQAEELSQTHRQRMIPLISPSKVNQNRDAILEAPLVELTSHDTDALEQIRKINPKAPIAIRLPFTADSDRVAADLVGDGVDAIHLFANYHGEQSDAENPRFVNDLIRSVHRRLVKESLRDEVTLIVSGGIILAEHVPKAVICGADLVALDTTVLVALQAQFLGECASPESGQIKPEKFDAGWGEQRLVNLIASWHDQLIEILSAMGMRDVRRLRGDVGRAMFNEELEKEAFADIPRGT